MPASNLKPEEREVGVDSSASMHMISNKDLSDAEMDTLTKSCSPTIVITASGEVQTHEEATVYVKELDTFLTVSPRNTPAVLSLGNLCDENGYSYEWINGKKTHISLKTEFGFPADSSTSRTLSRQESHRLMIDRRDPMLTKPVKSKKTKKKTRWNGATRCYPIQFV